MHRVFFSDQEQSTCALIQAVHDPWSVGCFACAEGCSPCEKPLDEGGFARGGGGVD